MDGLDKTIQQVSSWARTCAAPTCVQERGENDYILTRLHLRHDHFPTTAQVQVVISSKASYVVHRYSHARTCELRYTYSCRNAGPIPRCAPDIMTKIAILDIKHRTPSTLEMTCEGVCVHPVILPPYFLPKMVCRCFCFGLRVSLRPSFLGQCLRKCCSR